MSTLKADTIQSTGGGAATLTKQHAAKAWSNYSGSGTTFRDSFNHSSATDHGTAAYTVTLTNNMSNTNYSYTASSTDGGGGRSSVFSPLDFDNYLTGSMRGINNDTGNATEDTECVSSTFHGDLA
jgi:hypothetical protein